MSTGWDSVRDGIQAAIVRASGFDASRVIWGFQNMNAPPLSYVELAMRPIRTIGLDYVQKTNVDNWVGGHDYSSGAEVLNDSLKRYVCTTGGHSASSGGPTGTGSSISDGSCVWSYGGANQEIKTQVQGVREIGLEMTVFTASTADNTDASVVCETIKSSLLFDDVRDLMSAVGVSPFDPGEVQYVPEIVSVGFRGRATCVVRCYAPAQAVYQYITFIQHVNGTITAHGATPDPLTKTFST